MLPNRGMIEIGVRHRDRGYLGATAQREIYEADVPDLDAELFYTG